MTRSDRNEASCHARSVEEVLRSFGTDGERGLTAKEAESRLAEHGPNRLRESERRGMGRILVDQLRSAVIYVLGAAGLVAFVFARWAEGIAISAVVALNAAIGFVSEWRATRSMEALRRIGRRRARVRRDGEDRRVPSDEIVPGDLVLVRAGEVVPADLRIVEAGNLRVIEAALTGESVASFKSPDAIDEDTPLAERSDMLYRGTSVAEGSAVGVAVATGMDTELGRIADLAGSAEKSATPLQRRLDRLGGRFAWIVLATAAGVAAVGLLAGQPPLLMIETAIALGVAAIPEGLPIVATIALARGMWLMASRNALLNRLTAVETLGATTVIFSDKTGTLTENRMTLRRVVTPDRDHDLASGADAAGQEEDDPLLRRMLEVGVLCNNASLDGGDGGEPTGDPTEVALLRGGREHAGLDRDEMLEGRPEVREVSFDPDRMMMATYHEGESGIEVAVKGAPSAVLEACDRIADGKGEASPFEEAERERWLERASELAEDGLRLLALSDKSVASPEEEPYEGLRLLGLVGLLDPVREGIRDSLRRCREAGIRVVMVTGDQPETARAIGARIGFGKGKDPAVIHGKELGDPEEIDEEDRQRCLETDIFARMTPEQKLRLIEIYQREGETVAMTGDGVNDTPALKKADIGIAMGRRGTHAAKQTADMVLKDDAFSSIVAAVEQGRVIFDNIRKSTLFMICTNAAEVLAVAVAALAAIPPPLRPLQILFLNVVTDVLPALALGVGKGSPRVMDRPPRSPDEAILTAAHWKRVALWSPVLGACVLTALALGGVAAGMPKLEAITVSFLTLAFAKLAFVFILRDRDASLLRNDVVRNPWIWASIGACAALLILATYLPGLSDVLETRPLGAQGWGIVLGLAFVPLLLDQALRAIRRARRRGSESS
jgi:Ca2+-transporting ATPase